VRQRGFTLLEILVVVVVIAIISAAVLLSARGAASDRQIEDEARRLSLVLQLICDEAVIEGRFAGIGYAEGTYSAYDLTAQGWQPTRRDGPLHEHELPTGLGLAESGASERLPPTLPERPQLVCAPTGEIGEHDLILASEGADAGWRIALNRDGVSELTAWSGP
jgi:general secretion pathway protein H